MITCEIRKSCFGAAPEEVMDFFLKNMTNYYTPLTASLSMDKSHYTVKDSMRFLWKKGYLTKISHDGTVYHITIENMRKWAKDFKAHILEQCK